MTSKQARQLRKQKIKQLLLGENSLIKKYNHKRDQTIVVDWADEEVYTNEGEVKHGAFEEIKTQAVYLKILDTCQIAVPTQNTQRFAAALEKTVAGELYLVKKKESTTKKIACLMLFVGTMFLALAVLLNSFSINLLTSTVEIIAWVFLWTFAEKLFLELPRHKAERVKLLQITQMPVVCVATIEKQTKIKG